MYTLYYRPLSYSQYDGRNNIGVGVIYPKNELSYGYITSNGERKELQNNKKFFTINGAISFLKKDKQNRKLAVYNDFWIKNSKGETILQNINLNIDTHIKI